MLQIVFATTTTTVSNGPGSHIVIHEGEHWWDSDPIVKGHPGLFTRNSRHGLCSSVALPEDDELEDIIVADNEWTATVQALKEAGLSPADALAAVEASQTANAEGPQPTAETSAQEEKSADASQSEAPVEQATKAPGEKSTTRRGTPKRA